MAEEYNDEAYNRIRNLKTEISQLKYAIRQIHTSENKCSHEVPCSSYNGQAVWCYACKGIWLVEDIAKTLMESQ